MGRLRLEYKSLVCAGSIREAIIITEHGDRSDLIVSNGVEEPTTNARKKASKPVNLDLCTHDLNPYWRKFTAYFKYHFGPGILSRSIAGSHELDFGIMVGENAWNRLYEWDRTPGPVGYRFRVERWRASNSSGRPFKAFSASAYVAHCRFLLCFSGHSACSVVTVAS